VQIRIEGSDLPGRSCHAAPNFPGYENIHVAVQKRGKPNELLGLTPGDAKSVEWTFDCDVQGVDIKGPYIQGRPGDRFIYLSWGSVDDDGTFLMFRRAKLMLDAVDPSVIAKAQRSGQLVARLRLTDGKGQPLCAAVRPPTIEWDATPPA
jgi:Family of unknown function (DUF5990)